MKICKNQQFSTVISHQKDLGIAPSIEDKVHRFSDKDRHQIFLEPEGLISNIIYPNGISTSLPERTQLELFIDN